MKGNNKTGSNNDLLFGIKPIEEAVLAGKTMEKVFLKKGGQGPGFKALFDLLRARGIPFQMVPQEKLDRLTRKNHQGAVALASAVEYTPLEEITTAGFERGELPRLVLLDRITDVRNVGAIARSAEALGAHALILPQRDSAPLAGDAVKASAGALLRIPVCKVPDLWATVQELKHAGFTIICATEKGSIDLRKAEVKGPWALVLGNEEDGIQSAILKSADLKVKIPMQRSFDSLNVSVAAGILLYALGADQAN
jgi:23S rRNA (guanosine2251-2'-O)-methyltransferase